jgi:hypothetical protein
MPKPAHPDYFFECPKCHSKIRVLIGGRHLDLDEQALFSVDCDQPDGCGWSGDLPFSEAHPLPM